MQNHITVLTDPETLVILTTCPAGLGHLRVMSALRSGLPIAAEVEEVGVVNRDIQTIHRLTSIHPGLRAISEFVQNNPLAEGGFTRWYRSVLRYRPEAVLHQMMDIIKRRRPQPKTVVIVCTHFGLAHQLAVIKQELARTLGIRVLLAVVVTDDSPQLVWAVPGADIEFVPSATTRSILWGYLEKIQMTVPELVVVPYPVHLGLGERLTEKEMTDRTQQLSGESSLQVMVPVSGAAVHLEYLQDLMTALSAETTVRMTVVARQSSYTHHFLDRCQEKEGICVQAHWLDHEVVETYDRCYGRTVFGVEVTKPSEQTFKTLLTPKERGGVIMLFAEPVGRQEDDNLMFLRRHDLLPSLDDQQRLRLWVRGTMPLPADLKEKSRRWRGLMLPEDGTQAAKAILRFRDGGLLAAMGDFAGFMPGHDELAGDGVKRIWEKVSDLVRLQRD